MDVENHVYGPEVVISFHTNQPIDEPVGKSLVFWCGICKLHLSGPMVALQHMRGRPHRGKAKNPNIKRDSSSTNTSESVVNEPASKKSKEETASDSKVKCEICKMEFSSTRCALEHFKGKRHTTKLAQKFGTKQKNESTTGGQGRGRAQGGRGQGAKGAKGLGKGNTYGRGAMNKVIPDLSSPNFLPVGKRNTVSSGVGLLSNHFVSAASKIPTKPNQPTTKHSNNKPSLLSLPTYNIGIKPSDNIHDNKPRDIKQTSVQGNEQDNRKLQPGNNKDYHTDSPKYERDGFHNNPMKSMDNVPNIPRNDRGSTPINTPNNMQLNASRSNSFSTKTPDNMQYNVSRNDRGDFPFKPSSDMQYNNVPRNDMGGFPIKPLDNTQHNAPRNSSSGFSFNLPDNTQYSQYKSPRNDTSSFSISQSGNMQYTSSGNNQYNVSRNDMSVFSSNPADNMQRNVARTDNADYSYNSRDNMPSNAPRNDFGMQNSNYPKPSNYLSEYQSQVYSSQPKEYFSQSNLSSQKNVPRDGTSSIMLPPKDRPSLLPPPPKDNFSTSTSNYSSIHNNSNYSTTNYSSSNYSDYSYSTSTASYDNNDSNNYSYISNGNQMTTDARYDLFFG